MKALVEKELGIEVLGFVPEVPDCCLESRHLGLLLPHEIPALKEKLLHLAEILKIPWMWSGFWLLQKTRRASTEPDAEVLETKNRIIPGRAANPSGRNCPDEAFCFFMKTISGF